jgi:hypothetical protein
VAETDGDENIFAADRALRVMRETDASNGHRARARQGRAHPRPRQGAVP